MKIHPTCGLLMLVAGLFLLPQPAHSQCATIGNHLWLADTLNGAQVGGDTDLQPLFLTQNGCNVTGSFKDPHCGINHQVTINLANGDLFISRSGGGTSTVMKGKVTLTANSFSWDITSTDGKVLLANYTEHRTFKIGVNQTEVCR